MVTGTLLVCCRCGACVDILRERLTAEWIDSHREDFLCDCGAALELAEIEEAA